MTTKLAAGQKAPAFTLSDANGNSVSLSDYAGRSLIIYFYPKAATPGCTTEACDFRDSLASLTAGGYDVVGISPDDPEDLQAFTNDQQLTFPLLSDDGAEVAKAYGSFGPKTINGNTFDGTLRSTFVVDGEGTLIHAAYEVQADGHVAELRKTLGI